MSRRGAQRGFTLVELLVVVAILGVLAAIAIPSFTFMVRRSKSSEVSANLNLMFKSAASYYTAERTGQGGAALTAGFCTVAEPATRIPATPGPDKQRFPSSPEFRALGFTVSDFVYYSYGYFSPGDMCGHTANQNAIYTFYANGDLDGDLQESTFELACGTDDDNVLYHSKGFFIRLETE